MNHNSVWTAEKLQDLERRLAMRVNGRPSLTVIAAQMGVTKNSLVGRVHRMKGKSPRERPQSRVYGRAGTKKQPAKLKEITGAPEPLKEPTVPIDRNECAWINGDPSTDAWAYCGHKTVLPGASYCGFHTNICYVQQTGRKR